MDFRVRWLKPATLDLESQVRRKVLDVGPELALAHFERINLATESLQALPDRGRLCPKLPGYRELILKPDYRIVYCVDHAERVVKICAVIASLQDFSAAWHSRLRT